MPQITVNVPSDLYAEIQGIAAAKADEDSGPMTDEQTARYLIRYAVNRMAALARHKDKVRAAKDGDVTVAFRRYTPILPAPEFDAPETEPEVADWAHIAPTRSARAPDPTAHDH